MLSVQVPSVTAHLTWETASYIATVFGSAVVVVTAPLIVWQLIEARRATNAQSFFAVLAQLQNEDIREARKIVFSLKGKACGQWTADEIAAAEKVCHTYGSVGIMVYHGMLPRDIILFSWQPSLKDVWPIIKPLVLEYRKERGHHYWKNLEWLVCEASRYKTRAEMFKLPDGWNG